MSWNASTQKASLGTKAMASSMLAAVSNRAKNGWPASWRCFSSMKR
jgi:hypothetical protein